MLNPTSLLTQQRAIYLLLKSEYCGAYEQKTEPVMSFSRLHLIFFITLAQYSIVHQLCLRVATCNCHMSLTYSLLLRLHFMAE